MTHRGVQTERDRRLADFTVERAADTVLWVDEQARIRRVNEAACRTLGYARDELLSMTIHDIDPDYQADTWPEHWAALMSNRVRRFETRHRTKDGRLLPVEVSSNYIDLDGKVYTCSFARDISDRKQAEAALRQSEARLRQIIDLIPHNIFAKDQHDRFLLANRASAEFFGATVEAIEGRPHREFVRDAVDHEKILAADQSVFSRRERTFVPEIELTRADGERRTMQVTIIPFSECSSSGPSILGVAVDLTDYKRMEAKLIEEAKVAEVARVLGNIGHDIKNMLMPILSGVELLQDDLGDFFGQLPETEARKAKASKELSQDVIEMVRTNSRRIQERVREIADAIKGRTSPPQFKPCRIANVVASVIETLQLYARERHVTLRMQGLEGLPEIEADERRLFNAFYNLINNAIPEIRGGGSVTVSGKADPSENLVTLSVIDTGRGMPPEVRDSLFTERSVSGKAGGTGLGTKIVKDVVDAHGGRITVESAVGLGTSFHLALPIRR